MGHLTEAEKAELLQMADSESLRRDLRALRSGRAGTAAADFDAYIRFATAVARMAGHPRRPFRPIIGTLMRI